MGCDGGTIPRRDELVKTKKKAEEKDKVANRIFQWRFCAISQELLRTPIVTCGLGKLYNKSVILEGLINKIEFPEGSKHIKSIKDVRELNLTANPAYNPNISKEYVYDNLPTPFICPITGIEMKGNFKFVCLWTCGCVFSERVLREIHINMCILCQTSFEEIDIVILNASDEDVLKMRQNMIGNRNVRIKRRRADDDEAYVNAIHPGKRSN